MKPLSSTTINNIVNQDLSTREIANRTGVSQNTIYNIKMKHLPRRKGKKSGRPSILKTRRQRLILRKITSGQLNTAVDIQHYLQEAEDINIHADTIRNSLKEADLKSFLKVKKPLL